MSNIQPFSIVPKSVTEAMELAKMIANSNFCPTQMRGKPGDVILAMQMGSEIGLSPMQAIQNITVINNRPCLWGDGALAVAMASHKYESHREWQEGSIQENNLTAYCGVTRKGASEHIKSYGIEDAKKANLWGKSGPWTQYPERMLQMRARAFAIRDQFADALRGIQFREEVEDYQPIEKKYLNHINIEQKNKTEKYNPVLQISEHSHDESIIGEPFTIEFCLKKISECESIDDLQYWFNEGKKNFKDMKEEMEYIIIAKDKAKIRIEGEVVC